MRLTSLLLIFGLSACATITRSPASGYQAELADEGFGLAQTRAEAVVQDAREELGFSGEALSSDDERALDLRVRLKRAESRLENRREKAQYYGVRGLLKDDGERLYFLSLPSVEARARYAGNRGFNQPEGRSEEMAKTIEAKDIALGMTQKGVLESWGDPDAIEVAGQQIYGFERWKYSRYMGGSDGYQKEARIVYFESGRVVGWERH